MLLGYPIHPLLDIATAAVEPSTPEELREIHARIVALVEAGILPRLPGARMVAIDADGFPRADVTGTWGVGESLSAIGFGPSVEGEVRTVDLFHPGTAALYVLWTLGRESHRDDLRQHWQKLVEGIWGSARHVKALLNAIERR